MRIDKNSFLIYWLKIKDLSIPQPKTEVVMLTEKEFEISFDACPKSLTAKVHACIDKHFKLPVFLRTDLSSAKHGWIKTCYYDGAIELWEHLYEIMTFNHCADFMGLPFRAIIVREYIPMASGFTAFYGDMPVNPERRYFIKDGQVLCHHHYWIEEAIKKSKEPSIKNWRHVAKELNYESEEEIQHLTSYAQLVADVMDGFWSVDFCLGADRQWYLIDMAQSESSWHPECPKNINLAQDKRNGN